MNRGASWDTIRSSSGHYSSHRCEKGTWQNMLAITRFILKNGPSLYRGSTEYIYKLQGKMKFKLKWSKPSLILIFLHFLTLIIICNIIMNNNYQCQETSKSQRLGSADEMDANAFAPVLCLDTCTCHTSVTATRKLGN